MSWIAVPNVVHGGPEVVSGELELSRDEFEDVLSRLKDAVSSLRQSEMAQLTRCCAREVPCRLQIAYQWHWCDL